MLFDPQDTALCAPGDQDQQSHKTADTRSWMLNIIYCRWNTFQSLTLVSSSRFEAECVYSFVSGRVCPVSLDFFSRPRSHLQAETWAHSFIKSLV